MDGYTLTWVIEQISNSMNMNINTNIHTYIFFENKYTISNKYLALGNALKRIGDFCAILSYNRLFFYFKKANYMTF